MSEKTLSDLSHDRLEDALVAFLDFWSGKHTEDPTGLFTDDVQFRGSHRGERVGRESVADLLTTDFRDLSVAHLTSSNEVVRVSEAEALVGAYFFGEVRKHAVTDGGDTLFGGFVLLQIRASDGVPLIYDIRLQMNWVQDKAGLLAGWISPVQDRAWRPGDRSATIVSELDSPWAQFDRYDAGSDEYAVAEAWYRYAWALDQADFALLVSSFSENAEAILTPMGHLRGRRELVATLKAFRLPWPWMQHYGTPLRIEVDGEQGTARLWIGRLMPGKIRQADGTRLLGAHYEIRLRRQGGEPWRIEWMEYVPGWFSA